MSKDLNNKLIAHVQNAITELSCILQELRQDNLAYDEVKKR